MIRIIDATLCMLDDYNLTREKIYSFTKFMEGIGIKELQISRKIYEILAGELPDGFTYYLEVDTASYLNQLFPSEDERIKYIFSPKRKEKDNEIPTFHINNLEEPFRCEEYKNTLVKIIGLDSLILGGVNNGFDSLKKRVNIKKTILCPENTYSCATAIAVLFLQEKGYAVVSTMLGVGNKAATEQILLSLHVLERYMINRKFGNLLALRNWMEDVQNLKTSPMMPVIGRRIFYVESGLHVDGILKKPTNYEPYLPELVGLSREVVLGKHSGKNSIKYKLKQLRPDMNLAGDMDNILEDIKSRSRISGQSISDNDFIKIIERYERNEKNT